MLVLSLLDQYVSVAMYVYAGADALKGDERERIEG